MPAAAAHPRRAPTPALVLAAAALLVVGAGCGSGNSAAGENAPWPDAWRYPADAEPTRADRGMVVTTDELASRVGLDVLRSGGNAVDAAVAVSFALAVVNPEAGNIGGGGFMMVRLADGSVAALDYRERAPLAATRDMFLDEAGNLSDRSVVGHLAVGVPGTVMGMWEAHRRFGTRPWGELLAPAVALAEGFEVRPRFLNSLGPEMVRALSAFPASAAQFLPRGGAPPVVGDTLRQLDLARTLARIRDRGAEGFYAGETADLIVAEMERGGGILTHEDLARYTAAWREPVAFEYRGYTVHSMPPSSSGGVTLAEAANIVEGHDLAALPWDGAERVHVLAEAWRRAYADRNHYLGDPDFVPMPIETLSSQAYADWRRATIAPDGATPSGEVAPGVEAYRGEAAPAAGGAEEEGEHTTHFSIVDTHGNAVAVTTTINSWYGSKVTVAGAGFVLNNEMDDFAAKPGTPNQFGLVQGERNAVEPGKRMLSAMTPAIVEDPAGGLFLVTGTPGGSTIITTVFQTISNVVDHGMNVSQAVLAPRVHHQHLPDQIFYEPDGLSAGTVAALRALGHTVVERGDVSGDVQAIAVLPDGTLAGQSDPRRGGAALGY
ncbi:MAG: gamma-glutamyltransferase [Longimicrobiales bacterium]|nr:gamma-glutamyltransferase [Longimicrobiales bacterium]